jgi:AbiJ N-terminal domain 4
MGRARERGPKMATDGFEERKRLTFEQAEGVEPLPAQLKLKELSPEFRAIAWALFLESIDKGRQNDSFGTSVAGAWKSILRERHIFRLHLPADEFDASYKVVLQHLKPLFMAGDYTKVLGFLQFAIRHPACPYQFEDHIDGALARARAAYRVVGKTIVPIGSEAELGTIKRALVDLAASEFRGARAHLLKAAEALTSGDYPGSIRESIHSVESVVRVLEPSGDFSKALATLESKIAIHGALKKGFAAIYGFTSDEKGIRHPLLDDPTAKVDETDALFIIGACAAFVSYLINKARTSGLIK